MTKLIYRPVTDETDSQAWNTLVTHPMQSWEWGNFRRQRQKITRLGGYKNGTLIRAYLIVWTNIKYSPWSFGYIPMSPIPSREDLGELRNAGKENGAIGIRIEPIFGQKNGAEKSLELKRGRALFKAKTFVIDLTQAEEKLLSNMHPKGRYNIKVAARHGVVIKQDNSDQAFEKYLSLVFGGTVKRQGIYLHSEIYHKQMWQELRKTEMASLWTATYQGEVLAADIIFKFHDWIYYAYGASALEHKEVMAPTLLLWEIIKWGKNRGSTKFDLWGAEEGRGFSRFKEQFGGELINLPGSFDLTVNPVLYPVFRIAEEVRWKALHGWR